MKFKKSIKAFKKIIRYTLMLILVCPFTILAFAFVDVEHPILSFFVLGLGITPILVFLVLIAMNITFFFSGNELEDW